MKQESLVEMVPGSVNQKIKIFFFWSGNKYFFMFSDRILNNQLEKLRTKKNPSLLQELVQIARYSFKVMSPSIMTSERIDLGDVTCNNVGQLRKLNQVIFPVNYGDKFYQDVIEAGELAKLGKKKK